MKKVVVGVGIVLGLYLIVRAIAEPFLIDMADPSTYRDDHGGPSLAGVLAVHMGPGIVTAGVMVWAWRRRQQIPRASDGGAE